ncbi:MAG: hypothetical protein ACTSX7_18085 [Alphaproteobacteria bacterium]
MSSAQMDNTVNIAARMPAPDAITGTASPTAEPEEPTSAGDFFWHLLDVINPLQHIPVISTIYRALTGDEISPAAKLAGGVLFGGPLGAAAAVASIAIEGATGSDVGEHLLAAVTGGGISGPADQLAQAPALAPTQTASRQPPEPPRDTIIWNGVRQLPQLSPLAGPAASKVSSSTTPLGAQETNANAAIASTQGTPNRKTVQPAASANVSAAWLTTALTQAETLETANARGDTSIRVEPQPWIADAMMQALDQYESLAKQRQRQADTNTDANP